MIHIFFRKISLNGHNSISLTLSLTLGICLISQGMPHDALHEGLAGSHQEEERNEAQVLDSVEGQRVDVEEDEGQQKAHLGVGILIEYM